MTTVLAILITWYFTKVFYTKSFSIDYRKLANQGFCELTCFQCAKSHVIKDEHVRTPFYCYGCK
jgi:hypothetical protein